MCWLRVLACRLLPSTTCNAVLTVVQQALKEETEWNKQCRLLEVETSQSKRRTALQEALEAEGLEKWSHINKAKLYILKREGTKTEVLAAARAAERSSNLKCAGRAECKNTPSQKCPLNCCGICCTGCNRHRRH